METVYNFKEGKRRGGYLVTFNPLDGSSNVDVNVSVGAIFSVVKAPKDVLNLTAECFTSTGASRIRFEA